MAKKGFLLLLIIGLLIFVGCDGSTGNPDDVSNEITEEWFSTVANHWMDSDENGIGYVEGDGDAHIDIWYADKVFYIPDFTIEENQLTGTYTYWGDEGILGPFDIVITFSYENNILTAVFEGEDMLDGVTLDLSPLTE